MSKKTPKDWLAKYYPVPAHECPMEDAVAHSLRKWEGMRPEVLEQYGLRRSRLGMLTAGDEGILHIDSATCALCHLHLCALDEWGCDVSCPLALSGYQCNGFDEDDPYSVWFQKDDPEPMIAALKEILEEQCEH